jgi:hypothetical protein
LLSLLISLRKIRLAEQKNSPGRTGTSHIHPADFPYSAGVNGAAGSRLGQIHPADNYANKMAISKF